ncbi:MAG TPA: hypothetical protein VF939_09275 [Puia sp.]
MKRLSIIALFALTLISTSFANKTANPDFKGLENFNKTFPQATEVVYKVTEKFIKVNFTWHNMKLQAFYDLDGNSIGTSREIAVKDLPLSYLLSIKKEYPGYEPTEAIEFDQTDSGLSYYVTVVSPQKAYVLKVSTDGTIEVFKKMRN